HAGAGLELVVVFFVSAAKDAQIFLKAIELAVLVVEVPVSQFDVLDEHLHVAFKFDSALVESQLGDQDAFEVSDALDERHALLTLEAREGECIRIELLTGKARKS